MIVLLRICHLGRGVCLGADGGGGTNGKGVVYTLCPPKYRRGLNPSLVEGLIPYLEVVVSIYPQDLSPQGFLGLCHPNVVAILLGFISGILGLLQFLL